LLLFSDNSCLKTKNINVMENVLVKLLVIFLVILFLCLVIFLICKIYKKNNYKYKLRLKTSYEQDDDKTFFKALKRIDFFSLYEKNIFAQDEMVKIIVNKFYRDLDDFQSFLYFYNKVIRFSGRRGKRILSLFIEAGSKKDEDFWPKIYIQSIVYTNPHHLYFYTFIDMLPVNYKEIVYQKCLERINFYLKKDKRLKDSVLKIKLENDELNFTKKLEVIEELDFH
jgi:hypothetical protein